MSKTFKTFDEYLQHYKPKPPKPKGSKWYRMGTDATRKAADSAKGQVDHDQDKSTA